MTAGLPGAGIGGLFYLASSILLPLRGAWRRLRGQPDSVPWREQAHSLAIAIAIIGTLWMTGWLLSLVMPDELLTRGAVTGGAVAPARSILSMATLVVGVGTLWLVLMAVEIARFVHLWNASRKHERSEHRPL